MSVFGSNNSNCVDDVMQYRRYVPLDSNQYQALSSAQQRPHSRYKQVIVRIARFRLMIKSEPYMASYKVDGGFCSLRVRARAAVNAGCLTTRSRPDPAVDRGALRQRDMSISIALLFVVFVFTVHTVFIDRKY